jgi:tetratricopeptide (TPR) repeat protein
VPAQPRTALAALDVARPLVARLDISRDPEDVAADILDAWSATETALRAYLGGSGLGGQALVRELRQREMLSLEQTHSLLEFAAARDRANRPSYRPTGADVAAARDGFQRLEEALSGGGLTPAAFAAQAGYTGAAVGAAADASASPYAPGAPRPSPRTVTPVPSVAATGESGAGPAFTDRPEGHGPGRVIAMVLGAALVAVVLGFLVMNRGVGGNSRAMDDAIALYSQGKREAARSAFDKIARDDPSLALPHVYLGRIAREEGDMRSAQSELQMAVRLDPNSNVALREMGSYLLSAGNNELARKFYVRAVQAKPDDKSAQGFLGCALYRLGRTQEATTWLQRAGQGPWSACTVAPPPVAGVANPAAPGTAPYGTPAPR